MGGWLERVGLENTLVVLYGWIGCVLVGWLVPCVMVFCLCKILPYG